MKIFFCTYFCDLFSLDQVTVASLKGGALIMDYDKKELKPASHGTATVGTHSLGTVCCRRNVEYLVCQ